MTLLDGVTEDIGRSSPEHRAERALADAESFAALWTRVSPHLRF